ncbi:hypothetical protein Taro_020484, partial [Colocasia esculenta]|nr:hypothetical protein [Colocasia esculenta]
MRRTLIQGATPGIGLPQLGIGRSRSGLADSTNYGDSLQGKLVDDLLKKLQDCSIFYTGKCFSYALLESHHEMKVGIGAGYNVKSSITQAALHCPFLDGGLKCLNGTVILTLSRSYEMERNDLSGIVRAFRWITGFQGDIIFSGVHEPDLEPNLVVSTLFILGCNEPSISPKKSFMSSLTFHFNLLSSFLKREHSEQDDLSAYSSPEGSLTTSEVSEMRNGTTGDLDLYVEELETEPCGENKKSTNGLLEYSSKPVSAFSNNESEESSGLQGEQVTSWTVGPGFHIAQVWAKEREALSGNMPTSIKSNVFSLPVGVKSSAESSDISQSYNPLDAETLDHASGESLASAFPWGKGVDVPRKRGQLSARAESMLETEREREKNWTPILQMRYRGGTYRGRCQGGLPEGKGRLIFIDGSFYDGMWRGGRRSGLGTFCYSNGDVFQGAWKDDLMHGKGWFYFHIGDRWFVNFWKGKANGEGRFYSKSGSVFFGHFRDGWRHGMGISIDVDGTRYDMVGWHQQVV